MELHGSEAKFDISTTGNKTNETYMGTFRVKCLLSPIEQIEVDRLYREILGMNSHLAKEHVRQMAFALAELDQRIIEAPPFWENSRLGGGHIKDDNVLLEVLDAAIEAQEKYKEQRKQEMQERQQRLVEMIRKKQIEKEPDVEELRSDQEEDVEIE